MNKDYLLQPDIQALISRYEREDPAALMLRFGSRTDHNWPAIIGQIAARQKAARKLPGWLAAPGVLFPDPVVVEQASSEKTAAWKAARLGPGRLALDLTGGLGVDTCALASRFRQVDYVEADSTRAILAAHNFPRLGHDNIRVHPTRAETFLASSRATYDLVYLDPDRRPSGRRVAGLEQSSPDVAALLPLLRARARNILIKASPMTDIKAAARLLPGLQEVIVLAVKNEVKELLFRLAERAVEDYPVRCINLDGTRENEFVFSYNQEQQEEIKTGPLAGYLYEPHAAILKAGAFKTLAARFRLCQLHRHTHLYTAPQVVQGFPGRLFRVLGAAPYKKEAVAALVPEGRAHISARNFPDRPETVRRRLELDDGGRHYLFAYRGHDERLQVAVAEKISGYRQ